MDKDSGVIAQRETGRRIYSAPKLTVFGDVVALTAAGSDPIREHPKPTYADYESTCVIPTFPASDCLRRP